MKNKYREVKIRVPDEKDHIRKLSFWNNDACILLSHKRRPTMIKKFVNPLSYERVVH